LWAQVGGIASFTAESFRFGKIFDFGQKNCKGKKDRIVPLSSNALKDSLFLKIDMGNKIKIYPNPASSIIQIEMSSESIEDVYFEVFYQSARIVKSGKINSITTQLFIGDLTNGLYLIILKKQNGTSYKQKFIFTK